MINISFPVKPKWWRQSSPTPVLPRLLEWIGLKADVQQDMEHGVDHASLLKRRMVAFDLDPYELGQVEAALVRELQRRCMQCTSWRRCRCDLVREAVGRIGPDRHKWLKYCANARTLEMLSTVRDSAKHVPKYLLPYLGFWRPS